MRLNYRKKFIEVTFLCCIAFLIGCIPELTDETPLALVNNEPVTYGEFKKELQGFHLRKKEKGEKAPLELNNFLDKLIVRRLFIQEAIRTGLDKDPELDKTLESELVRQSIMYLHKEEIDEKVKVSDDDAWLEYCAMLKDRKDGVDKWRAEFSLDPNKLSKDIKKYISMLRKRATIKIDPNFIWKEEECDPNKIIANVNSKSLLCKDLSTALNTFGEGFSRKKGWKSILHGLIDQELLIQESERYLPKKDSFEKAKKKLKKRLLKERIKEREDEYINELRKNAHISRNVIDPNDLLGEDKDPNKPVAWVNDEAVTFGELQSSLKSKEIQDESPSKRINMIDQELQYLLDCRLVDQESLSRGYEKNAEVQKAIALVREKYLYNKFFKKILIPNIKLTDEEVKVYYKEHTDIFRTPVYIKVDEIRLNSKEKADKIWSELESGADFSFLKRSSLPDRITSRHWTSIDQFPQSIKESLLQINPGERVGPIMWEKGHSIFLLKRRHGGEVIPFDRARKDAYNKLWNERYNQEVKRWDKILRSSAEIVVYKDRLQAIMSSVSGDRSKTIEK